MNEWMNEYIKDSVFLHQNIIPGSVERNLMLGIEMYKIYRKNNKLVNCPHS